MDAPPAARYCLGVGEPDTQMGEGLVAEIATQDQIAETLRRALSDIDAGGWKDGWLTTEKIGRLLAASLVAAHPGWQLPDAPNAEPPMSPGAIFFRRLIFDAY